MVKRLGGVGLAIDGKHSLRKTLGLVEGETPGQSAYEHDAPWGCIVPPACVIITLGPAMTDVPDLTPIFLGGRTSRIPIMACHAERPKAFDFDDHSRMYETIGADHKLG